MPLSLTSSTKTLSKSFHLLLYLAPHFFSSPLTTVPRSKLPWPLPCLIALASHHVSHWTLQSFLNTVVSGIKLSLSPCFTHPSLCHGQKGNSWSTHLLNSLASVPTTLSLTLPESPLLLSTQAWFLPAWGSCALTPLHLNLPFPMRPALTIAADIATHPTQHPLTFYPAPTVLNTF